MVIDLHCDTIHELLKSKNMALKENSLGVDIKKLRKAKAMAQFFALFVDWVEKGDPLEICLEMVDRFYREMEENKEDISIVRNYTELNENQVAGKISAFLTIEEGAALKGKIFNLRNFYRLGVRLITLTWNYPNEIGFPNYEGIYSHKGLTSFGKEVIKEMNNLGMIIDVSHLSDQGFYDVARLSTQPFVASHSNSRTIKEHSRNLTDDMIKTLARKGGVMGINFASMFLGDEHLSRVEDMVRHIKHIKSVGGIDVISIGSDLDGISPPLEIENIGQIDKLIYALGKEGFSQDEIEKITHGNALRVIKDVLKQ